MIGQGIANDDFDHPWIREWPGRGEFGPPVAPSTWVDTKTRSGQKNAPRAGFAFGWVHWGFPTDIISYRETL